MSDDEKPTESETPKAEALRVLIVEDSDLDAKLLVREMRRGGYAVESRRVDSADDMRQALAAATWDVIVSDYDLPGFGGPQALALARESGLDLPFIIVSGMVGETVAVETMKAGAHDYLLKDNLIRLVPAIEREIREAQVRAQNRNSEAQVRASEEKYRTLFESSRDAIVTLDPPSWKITSANPAALDMYGIRDEGELPLKALWEYSPELQPDGRRSRDKANEMAEMAMREGHVLFEWHHTRLDGEEFMTTVLLNRIELGEHRFLQATVRDETERLTLERQVRQSQKMESIGTLAGGVAHEINNPISGIMGYADLILKRIDPNSQAGEFAREIKHETQRIATIVRNLLTFARQEDESQRKARPSDIVEATLSLIRTVMRHDQITLDIDIPQDLPPIHCHPQQIQQVLMNLMTNARDALSNRYPTYDERKKLILSARLFEEDGEAWVRFTIEDHGIGITSEVSERMFDPFFTTKSRAVGTGLGLSISHGIVKDHGGRLLAESEVGQYTRFHVELPVAGNQTPLDPEALDHL